VANDVEIVVKGTNRAKGLFDGVNADAGQLKTGLTQLSAGMKELDRQSEGLKRRISTLRDEFHKTGDTKLLPQIDDEVKRLKQVETQISKFNPFKDLAKNIAPDIAKAGAESGRVFTFGLFKTIQTLPPQVQAGLVGGIAAAATLAVPLIGGAIAAGALLGLGGGAIALGISSAIEDPAVSASFERLGEYAHDSLRDASQPLVQPLLDGVAKVEAAFGRAMPMIGRAFTSLAPTVDRLFDGVVGFMDKVGPGLDKALGAAGPVLDKLAAELPGLGESIGFMFEQFSRGSEGAIAAVGALFTILNDNLMVFGLAVNSASDSLGALAAIMKGEFLEAARILADIEPVGRRMGATVGRALKEAADAANAANPSFQQMQQSIANTAYTADTVFGAAVGKVFNSILSLDQAALTFAESQTNLSESLKDNSTHMDINTVKGQQNRQAILGAVQANMALFQANIAGGMGADEATAAYQANTGALEHQLRQAGWTQGAIDGLIGKYRSVPADVQTQIELHGLATAIADLNTTLRLINNLPNNRTSVINVVTRYTTQGAPTTSSSSTGNFMYASANAYGGITGAATGGNRSGWTMVGEQGRELIKLPPGTPIKNNASTEREMTASGGSGGPIALTIQGGTAFGTRLESALMEWLLRSIRTNDGGLQPVIKQAATV
jgi:hypothetical protein